MRSQAVLAQAATRVGRPHRPEANTILAAVARYYDVSVGTLLSPRRSASLARPRAVAMYLLRTETGWSYPECGRYFGRRHHTTILAAVRSIEKRRESDEALGEELEGIRSLATELEGADGRCRRPRSLRNLSMDVVRQPKDAPGAPPWVGLLTSADFGDDGRIRDVLAALPVGASVGSTQLRVARLAGEYRLHVIHITSDAHGPEDAIAQEGMGRVVQLCDRLIVLWGPSRLGTRVAMELAQRAGKTVEILGPEDHNGGRR